MEHRSDAFCIPLVSAIERTPQSPVAQALQAGGRTGQDSEASGSTSNFWARARRRKEHPRAGLHIHDAEELSA